MLLVLSISALAQLEEPKEEASKLPINVPVGANVDFQVDSAGKDLMPLIRQYLSGDPLGLGKGDLTVKTPLGTLNLKPEDVEALLGQIREVHAVSYSHSTEPDPLKRYENEWREQGYKRVGPVEAPKGYLLMQRSRAMGEFAFVRQEKGSVTVIKTDGIPDLGDVTRLGLDTLAKAAESAGKKKDKGSAGSPPASGSTGS